MTGGHIRARGKSWEIRWRANGQTCTETVRGTKRDAQRILRDRLAEADKGLAPARDTCAEWFDQWLRITKPELSIVTTRNHRCQVDRYLRPAFGAVALAKLTPATIQAEWSRLAEEGRLSASTRRALHKVLAACLQRAAELGMITANPCDALRRRLPRVEHREMAVLSPDEARELIDRVRRTPLHAPVIFALGLGARRGEIAALRWRHVDLDRGTVAIVEAARQTTAADVEIGQTKTGRARRVALPAFAVDELRLWKRQQAEQLLALGVRQSAETRCCTDQAGRALSPNQISDAFRQLGASVTFHGLRHTSASLALHAGASIKAVQERLGHSRASQTLDTYAHLLDGAADEAAIRLNDALGSNRGSKPG